MALFLIDEQLPPSLAFLFSAKGHRAEHVRRIGLDGATDTIVWERAKHTNAVLVTKDEDFISLSRLDPQSPQIVWIRLGNVSNSALVRKIEPLFERIIESIETGDRLIEIV